MAARAGVEAVLTRGGVAGRDKLLVRVVRVGHPACQYGVAGHLQGRWQVGSASRSTISSSAASIVLPGLASSLVAC